MKYGKDNSLNNLVYFVEEVRALMFRTKQLSGKAG